MEVHYVHGAHFDSNDPIVRKIMEFCSYNEVPLKFRNYDPLDYEEDRDDIFHLPAIHIYKRDNHEQTVYPNFKPIQFLQTAYDKFQLEELEKQSKTQIWEERIRYLRSIFRSSKTDSTASKSDRK